MPDWSVYVETQAESPEAASLGIDGVEAVDEFKRLIDPFAPMFVWVDEMGWSVTATIIDADRAELAAAAAIMLLREAATKAGLPDWPVTAVEVKIASAGSLEKGHHA